jgi:large subunit ribosomal protein L22
MEKATATLKNYRQSPRKVRVVSNLVKGKKIQDAIDILEVTAKRASLPIVKLIKSAVANALNKSISLENLVVENIRVDGGAILYRRRPVAHGSFHPIRKRTSHLVVSLTVKEPKIKKSKVKKDNK